jgi:hypothetical protein
MVSLDMSNPLRPVEVDLLTMVGRWKPHWLSMEPGGNRMVLTSGDGATRYRVLLISLDPATGKLVVDSTFRDAADTEPGVRFDRTDWPHGAAGTASPHGAVFSRPAAR